MRTVPFALLPMALLACAWAQAPANSSVLGTVTGLRSGSSEIEVKPDTAPAVVIEIGVATVAQKVAPGQTDLSKAEPIKVADVAAGDRVLITMGATEARRIVVIAATDLAKRDAADRLDWQRRGVAGVVTAVAGNEITVEVRSLAGAAKYSVSVGPNTNFKRYAPDSVKYSDAKVSRLSEVSAGDQIRARGQKTPDSLKVDAEEVVFGTFLSKAGTITAISPETREVTIKDLSNNKPLAVKFIADSQVKRVLDMATMTGMMAGGRGAGAPSASPASTSTPGVGRGPGAPPRGVDIAQMLELLPPIKFEDLKPGEIVVVSAIKGARADQITAITFLANAETLVQLAMAARGAGASGPAPSLAGLASSISSVGP